MDLSSLFGPPITFLTNAQVEQLAKLSQEEGVIGVGIVNYGPTWVLVNPTYATTEGGRMVPGESEVKSEGGIVVDFHGNVYPAGSADEFDTAAAAADEATSGLADEVEAYLREQDAKAAIELP